MDIVIVTALEEERDAVLDKLLGFKRLMPSEGDIRVYYEAELPITFSDGSTATYKIIVMPLLGMGRVQAATATGDAIRRWNPQYVILVGIAGGIAEREVKLGDILISDQIVDYELQKLTPNGPQMRWQVYGADPRLVGAAQNLRAEEWLPWLKVKRPGVGQPRRHIGPIASGDKVIAFAEVLNNYRAHWPKLIGVEMEAAGVAAAVFQAASPPGFFMVRGVSDLADANKGSKRAEKWRPYACDVAASYVVGLLKSGLVPSPNLHKPAKTQSLDTLVLQILYSHYLKCPGDQHMKFTDLIVLSHTNRQEMMPCLLGLREKNWMDYDLTAGAETGLVWLTALGIKVAEGIYEHRP